MKINIYVKCHFRGNPRGKGEAAAIVEYIDSSGEHHIRRQQVQNESETRNSLDLKICISSLRMLLKPCEVKYYANCDYMANVYQQNLLEKWQQAGWIRPNGKPPANVELWKQFYMLSQIHKINFLPYDTRYDTELNKAIGENSTKIVDK